MLVGGNSDRLLDLELNGGQRYDANFTRNIKLRSNPT